jgi:hypothetical protein
MDPTLQERLNDLRSRLIALNSQFKQADGRREGPIIETEIENVRRAIQHLEEELKIENTQDESS